MIFEGLRRIKVYSTKRFSPLMIKTVPCHLKRNLATIISGHEEQVRNKLTRVKTLLVR